MYGGDSNDTGSASSVVSYVAWPAAAVTTLTVTSCQIAGIWRSITFDTVTVLENTGVHDQNSTLELARSLLHRHNFLPHVIVS